MTLPAVLHAVLLVTAIIALAGAGWRLSSLIAQSGLERMVCCAVLSAGGAVLEALAAGTVGLGGSAAALTGMAVISGLAARQWLPGPAVPVSRELWAWWRRLGPAERAGIGAIAGAAVALGATLLRRPMPGFDGITYHIPEVVGFVQSGHTGAVLNVYGGTPVGNYPLTNEVLLAWLTGISHGFAALTLYSPASGLLMIAAGWLGLRALDVPRVVRVLALAPLILAPLVLGALVQPGTDFPALTWLICSASLCAGARVRPLLLVPALIAFALALGTKTTTVVLGVLVLAYAGWSERARLRTIRAPLLLGVAAAVGVGGVWYLRDLVQHGSPLWPFERGPWGDPIPPTIQLLSHTMAQRLQVTLLDHLGPYLSATSGSAVLLGAGLLIPLATLRRRPLIAAAAVAIGTLAWANAPVTGLPDYRGFDALVGSSVRYLMPVFAAGALALALVATDAPRGRLVSELALLGATAWSIVSDARHQLWLPFTSWILPGIALGTLIALLGGRLSQAPPRSRSGLRVPALAAAGLCAALVVGSDGFLARHAQVRSEWDAAAAAYLTSQPGYTTGRLPVASAPDALGLLAGDSLQHRVSLIGEREPCARVRARARAGFVVIHLAIPRPVPGHPGLLLPIAGTAQYCLASERPLFDDGPDRVYGPRS